MAVYVVGDIHGQYDLFNKMLTKIDLKDTDTLYVLGDVLDRGPHPVKTLKKLMAMPNVVCLVGNHELMALECLKFLGQEITEESIDKLDDLMYRKLMNWIRNGSRTTIKEYQALSPEEREEVIEFIKDFELYRELTVKGRNYLLVHAGLGNYEEGRNMGDYSVHDLVWDRPDFKTRYFEDTTVIVGHTPTQVIKDNPKPGFIYRANNTIDIDCGSFVPGGRLAALCLDTDEEFYVSADEVDI